MGAYLCIASNGVPPSVSKRIILDVECKYRTISLNNIIVLIKTYSKRYTTPPKLLCTYNIINYILLSCYSCILLYNRIQETLWTMPHAIVMIMCVVCCNKLTVQSISCFKSFFFVRCTYYTGFSFFLIPTILSTWMTNSRICHLLRGFFTYFSSFCFQYCIYHVTI